MPIRIFRASGTPAIDRLEDLINSFLRKLKNTDKVKEIHMAMSPLGDNEATVVVTVWYTGSMDAN